MRYGRAERLIQLAIEMQAARTGLTISDIMERFSVSRRTAIRMRDAVLSAFPQADEVRSSDRRKRWRLPPSSTQRLIGITADQLASLELGAVALERMDLAYHAETVRGLGGKIRALLSGDILRQIEPDFDALMQSEVIMHRPRPVSHVAASVLDDLRTAIKSCRKVSFHYASSEASEAQERRVAPLGLVYGHRHYLVGRVEPDKPIKFFALGRISNLNLTSDSFDVSQDIDLRERVATSFGAFDEAPHDIIWKFSAEAADAARRYVFHPRQSCEDQSDGSLIVKFRAGGLLEMAWHLLQWGAHVEVLAPERLRTILNGHRPSWPALP
jgi:predicted DNA-binding transcriptional regulator YafY